MFCMWASQASRPGRHIQFFLIMLSNDSASNYYSVNFALQHYYHLSFADLEAMDRMLPFEREIYIGMMVAKAAEEAQPDQK